jgi:hypothetical protein
MLQQMPQVENKDGSPSNGTNPLIEFSIAIIGRIENVDRRLSEIAASQAELRQLITVERTEKEWYSTTELAEIMGVKQYTVQERWCNQGRIECDKDPDSGKWRIPGTEARRIRDGGSLGTARQ